MPPSILPDLVCVLCLQFTYSQATPPGGNWPTQSQQENPTLCWAPLTQFVDNPLQCIVHITPKHPQTSSSTAACHGPVQLKEDRYCKHSAAVAVHLSTMSKPGCRHKDIQRAEPLVCAQTTALTRTQHVHARNAARAWQQLSSTVGPWLRICCLAMCLRTAHVGRNH
jgi:hypothetical protein